MSQQIGNLVIRTYAPVRRRLLLAGLVLLAVFALYVTYEFGRYDAGYDRLAVAQERTEHEVEREHLEKSNRELRVQLAQYETTHVGETRERAEVERTIGELQGQIARLEQQLAFLRGIVQQAAPVPEVKIQQLRVVAGKAPLHFSVRLTLEHSSKAESSVSGALGLQVEGTLAGHDATLNLQALTAGKRHELPFTFRYFEHFEQEIILSPGLRPERVTVELRSARKGVPPVTQSFVWTVDPS